MGISGLLASHISVLTLKPVVCLLGLVGSRMCASLSLYLPYCLKDCGTAKEGKCGNELISSFVKMNYSLAFMLLLVLELFC